MDMGERIRYVRRFRGMTQTELAEKIGLPPGENGRIRISQYENGTHIPKEEMLEKISEALGIHSMYLSTKPQTSLLDFVWGLFEFDRNFPITITQEGKRFNLGIELWMMDEFFKQWMQKKADLESGKISEDDYIEWTINYTGYED